MNILQQEDAVKGLPDDALMQEAQAPSGQVPQFLVVSEIQRRADMRKRYQEQEVPQGTVAEQIIGQAQQGIAAMQPQGMPPQGMPPQGMPPQGMPPQIPPQGMPPQQMAPQQMFGGGIIRLQGGGLLDQQSSERPFYPTRANAGNQSFMPRGMTVRDKIQSAIESGATMADLLSIFRNNPEAVQEIRMMYMTQAVPGDFEPSDKFAGDTRRQLIQDPSVSDMDKAMISNDLAADMTADKIGSQFNYFQPPEFLGDVVQAGIGAMEKIPSEQDMIDFYRGILPEAPEKGAAEEAGRQFGERVRGGVADLLDRQSSVVDPSRRGAGAKRGGAEPQGSGGQMARNSGVERQGSSSIQRQASGQAIDDAIERLAPDSYVSPYQDQIAALYDQYAGQEPTVPELSKAIALAQDNLNDASSKNFSTASSPSLDLSDLIADAKKMSQANALMQLGAGIAGGDLSKGLSAAGMAATKGTQDARKIAMSQRLAEYNAGRQDLDRQQKESQFSRRLALMEKQLEATIEKGERVSRAQLMNMATELAVEAAPEFGGGENAPTVQDIFNDLLRKYAPFMDVDVMTLPPSEVVKAGQAGRANDPMGLRG